MLNRVDAPARVYLTAGLAGEFESAGIDDTRGVLSFLGIIGEIGGLGEM